MMLKKSRPHPCLLSAGRRSPPSSSLRLNEDDGFGRDPMTSWSRHRTQRWMTIGEECGLGFLVNPNEASEACTPGRRRGQGRSLGPSTTLTWGDKGPCKHIISINFNNENLMSWKELFGVNWLDLRHSSLILQHFNLKITTFSLKLLLYLNFMTFTAFILI